MKGCPGPDSKILYGASRLEPTRNKTKRPRLLIWGAFGMLVCHFIVASVGDTVGFNHTHAIGDTRVADNIKAVNAQIAFICIYIFFFASSWGPGAWVITGEIFPLSIRSRSVGLVNAGMFCFVPLESMIAQM